MTYYNNFLDYVKDAVKYKMDTLDPNLVKRFLYAIAVNNTKTNVEAKELDD
jgi:hypothetical protein